MESLTNSIKSNGIDFILPKKRGMKRDGESENLLVNMCCAFYKKSDCKLCITRKTMGICSQTYIDIDENKNKNEIK